MTAARIALLVVAVAGAVVRPRGLPAWVAPVVCAGIALAAGTTTGSRADHALAPLAGALAFLLAAVPLAALLERAGVFAAATNRFGDGPLLVPGLWVLAAATTAVLNLDASVVLLTPLYARIAQRVGLPVWSLAIQPLVLSYLASSFLPVSNLTNLIAVGRTGVGAFEFVGHLGLPSLCASATGYVLYRRFVNGAGTDLQASSGPRRVPASRDERRALALGGGVTAILLVGFLAGPAAGIEPWVVALVVDGLLLLVVRAMPSRAIPWGTALVAAGLAILADAVAASLPLDSLLGHHGAVGSLQTAAVGAALGNLINNLPALLVALPFVAAHHPDQLWALLVGVNMGPALLVTGTLAALLWRDLMAAIGTPVTAREILRIGLRVTVPAAVVGTLVLVTAQLLVGGG